MFTLFNQSKLVQGFAFLHQVWIINIVVVNKKVIDITDYPIILSIIRGGWLEVGGWKGAGRSNAGQGKAGRGRSVAWDEGQNQRCCLIHNVSCKFVDHGRGGRQEGRMGQRG